jgi:site-specific recombinase XerD
VPDDHHDCLCCPDPGGLTRQAYELDLRQYTSWCQQHHLRLFQARRADIECFAKRGCGRRALSLSA